MPSSKRQERRQQKQRERRAMAAVTPNGEPLAVRLIEATGDFDIIAAEGETGDIVRKFTMTAYTGGKLVVARYPLPVVVDLSGLRLRAKASPIFRDHSPAQIVGHTETIDINAGSIKLAGLISGANRHAREVIESADNGFPWQSSIGAIPEQLNYVDEGEKVEVNGRKFVGPLYVARKALLAEVSFVAFGADAGTSAKIAATLNPVTNPAPEPPQEPETMNFEQWLQAGGFNAEEIEGPQRDWLLAKFHAEQGQQQPGNQNPANPHTPTTGTPITAQLPTVDETLRQHREAIAADTRRVDNIRRICAQYSIGEIEIDGENGGEPRRVNLASHAIEAGWDAQAVELHALRNARAQAPVPGSRSNAGGGDGYLPSAAVIEAALCIAAGMPEATALAGLSEQDANRVTSREFRGFSLHEAMQTNIEAAGLSFRGNRRSNEFIRTALEADRTIRASGGMSTLSLSGVLSNTANKALIASYTAVKTVWKYFCAVRNHNDFKVHTRYRLDSEGGFQKVGASGELKHIGLTDSSFTNQLDTHGAIIALTRQMQIDDDLGAFMEMPRLIGRMSALKIEEEAFKLLIANASNFFHSDNNNTLTDALDIDGLTAGVQKFENQVDSNNKPILVEPKTLLVGTALRVTADNLYKETNLYGNTTTNKGKPARNPHAGLYEPKSSPYLNNTSIKDVNGETISANQSDTLWYLFADPAVRAAFAVAFLNGQQLPTVQTAETDFNTLGMQTRAYLDFGVGEEDPAAAVHSTGGG